MIKLNVLIYKASGLFRYFFLNFFSFLSFGYIRKEIGIEKRIWNNLTNLEKKIVMDVYLKAKGHGVKFKISNGDRIQYCNSSLEVSGYFQGNDFGKEPEFGIAVGRDKDDWFLIFLHESCHMDQWVEGCIEWKKGLYEWLKSDSYDMLEQWIGGRKMDNWEIEGIIQSCIDIELDCEKRTVEKIRRYGLNDINITEYIQKANSYISFYGMILKKRKWYKNPPYEQFDVWNKMPRIFLVRDKYLRVDENLYGLYEKHCF